TSPKPMSTSARSCRNSKSLGRAALPRCLSARSSPRSLCPPLAPPSWRCSTSLRRVELRCGPIRVALHRRDFASLRRFSLASSPTASGRSPRPVYKLMDSLPTVLLKPGEADRVVAGHPWIYQGSILRLTQPARDGDLVQVKDHRQRFLGVGFFNSRSKIHVRMLAPERVAVDEGFFEQTIRAALGVRNKHLPDATTFRVVNSESDFLSGLVVDKYEDVLVLQTSSLGMDQRKPMIISAL